MLAMYAITGIICTTDITNLQVKNGQAVKDALDTMKLIFTPINGMIVLASLGNVFGKAKDQDISTEKAGKRLIIILVAIVIIFIFESSYIKSFITGVLG